MSQDDLIKAIDIKIKQLEKEETPNQLLKKALLKKGILSNNNVISEEKIEELFQIIKESINKN